MASDSEDEEGGAGRAGDGARASGRGSPAAAAAAFGARAGGADGGYSSDEEAAPVAVLAVASMAAGEPATLAAGGSPASVGGGGWALPFAPSTSPTVDLTGLYEKDVPASQVVVSRREPPHACAAAWSLTSFRCGFGQTLTCFDHSASHGRRSMRPCWMCSSWAACRRSRPA
jgi:hypothetical protein